MRKVLFIVLLVILSTSVYAGTYELRNHEPITINGRTFELSGRGENQVYVKIDGKSTKVTELLEYKEGMSLQLISYNDPYADQPLTATIVIIMDFTCSNDVCETGEKNYCCSDCGCLSVNQTCAENKCYENSLFKCFNSSDCNDNNPCTIDTCTGAPSYCVNNFTTSCESGDNCCPANCNKTLDYIKNDRECLPEPECWTDFDCDDEDELTIDLCDRKLKFCKFEVMVVKGQPVKSLQEDNQENLTVNKTVQVSETGQVEKQAVNYTMPMILFGLFLVLLVGYITIFKKNKNNEYADEAEEKSKSFSKKRGESKDRSSFK